MYESYISLYPNNQDPDTSSIFENISGIVKQMGLMQSGSLENNIDINDVILSRKLQKDLIAKKWNTHDGQSVNLIEFWELDKRGLIASMLGREKTNAQMTETAILEISSRLRIEENLTGLRKIYVKFEDPQISQDMANYIGDYLQNFISNELIYQAKNNRIFLEDRTHTARINLEKSEEKLKSFQEKYTLAIDDPDIILDRTRLSREVNINQEIYLVLIQQLELAKIEELKHRPIVNFIDRADLSIDAKYPRKILILFVFTLVGILISLLIALYREEQTA
jgi:hypothetical protein